MSVSLARRARSDCSGVFEAMQMQKTARWEQDQPGNGKAGRATKGQFEFVVGSHERILRRVGCAAPVQDPARLQTPLHCRATTSRASRVGHGSSYR